MRQANYDWKLRIWSLPHPSLQMIEKQGISPLSAKMLWQRGYREEKELQRF